jgi:hypothetical protein
MSLTWGDTFEGRNGSETRDTQTQWQKGFKKNREKKYLNRSIGVILPGSSLKKYKREGNIQGEFVVTSGKGSETLCAGKKNMA